MLGTTSDATPAGLRGKCCYLVHVSLNFFQGGHIWIILSKKALLFVKKKVCKQYLRFTTTPDERMR